MLTANTFYTITVTAPAEFDISKTGVYEVLTGQAFEIELPAEESYVWKITDHNTGKPHPVYRRHAFRTTPATQFNRNSRQAVYHHQWNRRRFDVARRAS